MKDAVSGALTLWDREVINGYLKKIDGVENIDKTPEEYIVKIASKDIIEKVFNAIKDNKNITKFFVEDPTLNEIFVSKVGETIE